jgi:hypothetical protein
MTDAQQCKALALALWLLGVIAWLATANTSIIIIGAGISLVTLLVMTVG